jgi:hypothetical protein
MFSSRDYEASNGQLCAAASFCCGSSSDLFPNVYIAHNSKGFSFSCGAGSSKKMMWLRLRSTELGESPAESNQLLTF